MNLEQLEKGKELHSKIKKKQKLINILSNSYINSILGYEDGREQVAFPLDGELREIIKKYVEEELLILENEFADL